MQIAVKAKPFLCNLILSYPKNSKIRNKFDNINMEGTCDH